jgi:hypothetical protein
MEVLLVKLMAVRPKYFFSARITDLHLLYTLSFNNMPTTCKKSLGFSYGESGGLNPLLNILSPTALCNQRIELFAA